MSRDQQRLTDYLAYILEAISRIAEYTAGMDEDGFVRSWQGWSNAAPFLDHDLRHEATSRLFEKGLGVMDVASMTGHKTLEMLKRYTHIEAKKLAKMLG